MSIPETRIGQVLRSQSGQYWVRSRDGGIFHCTLRGRFKRGRRARTDLVVIGDVVRLSLLEGAEGEGVIEGIEPRRNRFSRRQPGPRGRFKEDVLVANVDWIFAVFACARPAMNPRVLDRFLVEAELDAIDAAIVANKVDLVDDRAARSAFEPYARLGYPVFYTSVTEGRGVEEVRAHAACGISAFVGPSGVGKSSLLNALEPGLGLAVASVSETLDKGRHTTRVAELHPLSGGGWVADTPGIREIVSFELPTEKLAWCFREMRPLLGQCRFPDCVHDHEPDCAVRDAVARGEIAAARYDSYLRILRDEER